ncbi:MAG TPA: hypothetical protein VFG68_08930 [Fimbriiglobus sp.]|nr:hypothetical protein [Fimbriiglobus sp.]
MAAPQRIVSATRRLDPALVDLLKSLKTGDRIKVTQTVRVGSRTWAAETAGAYRGVNYLATGITTDRVPEDDIVVPTVHFTKDNGELASVSVDENTKISRA